MADPISATLKIAMNIAYVDNSVKQILVYMDENENRATNEIPVEQYNISADEVDTDTEALAQFSFESAGSTYTLTAPGTGVDEVSSVSVEITGRAAFDDNTEGDFLYQFNTEEDSAAALISQGDDYFGALMQNSVYNTSFTTTFTRAGLTIVTT